MSLGGSGRDEGRVVASRLSSDVSGVGRKIELWLLIGNEVIELSCALKKGVCLFVAVDINEVFREVAWDGKFGVWFPLQVIGFL